MTRPDDSTAGPQLEPTRPRDRLLQALRTMPDEAFSWLVVACMPPGSIMFRAAQIWPDGVGGFSPASRTAITEARAAAAELMAGKS